MGLNYQDFTFESGDQARKSYDILGEVTLFGNLAEDLNLTTGLVGERQHGPDLDRSSISEYTRRPFSAYGQLDYKPMEWLKVIGGAQWNDPDDNDADLLTRVGGIIDITSNTLTS